MKPKDFAKRTRDAVEASIIDLTHPQRAEDVPDAKMRENIVRARFDYIAGTVEAHMRWRDAENERLREALWQCGFWARNDQADDKTARLKIAHEAEKVLSPEYWAFKRDEDIEERWED